MKNIKLGDLRNVNRPLIDTIDKKGWNDLYGELGVTDPKNVNLPKYKRHKAVPGTAKIILWSHQLNKDGSASLRIRVTKYGKVSYTSLGISVMGVDFDVVKGRVKDSHANHIEINDLLDKKISEVTALLLNFMDHDIQSLRSLVKKGLPLDDLQNFFKFAEEHIKQFDNNAQHDTFAKYRAKLAKLAKYFGSKDISFKNLDVAFLNNYEVYLRKLGNSNITIHGDLRIIRAIYYAAIKEGVAKQTENPFFLYDMNKFNVWAA